MATSPVKSSTVEEEGGGDDTTTTAMNNKDEILQVGEKIYQSLDPLDPRKIALDIFEVYCHEMLWTKFIGRRAYLIIKMRVSNCFCVCWVMSSNYYYIIHKMCHVKSIGACTNIYWRESEKVLVRIDSMYAIPSYNLIYLFLH